MSNFFHITDIEIENFKNIEHGKISFPDKKEGSDSKNVLALYGQNGSGKTSVIQAIELVRDIIQLQHIPSHFDSIITKNKEEILIKIFFLMESNFKIFSGNYEIKIRKMESNLRITSESLSYNRLIKKEIENGYHNEKANSYNHTLTCDLNNENEIFSLKSSNKKNELNVTIDDLLSNKSGLDLLVAKRKSFTEKQSLITNEHFINYLYNHEYAEIGIILESLTIKFLIKTVVFSNWMNERKNMSGAYGILPFISKDDKEDKVFFLSKKDLNLAKEIFNQINIVLPTMIPDLNVSLREIGNPLLKNGEEGISIQLIAKKNGLTIPFQHESEGTKKIISLLSLFIAIYNDPDIFVAIDELDAGISEFLLGDIIKTINEHGKGQLLFTSHNLRLLEVLDCENFAFSTTNEKNRFIILQGIKQTNNLRSVYLRAIKLGGQSEEIYEKTSAFKMRKAFEHAGRIRYGKKDE